MPLLDAVSGVFPGVLSREDVQEVLTLTAISYREQLAPDPENDEQAIRNDESPAPVMGAGNLSVCG